MDYVGQTIYRFQDIGQSSPSQNGRKPFIIWLSSSNNVAIMFREISGGQEKKRLGGHPSKAATSVL